MPCHHGHFRHGQQNAEGRHKTFCALPVLLVALHAALQVGNAAAISVAQYSVLVVPSLK